MVLKPLSVMLNIGSVSVCEKFSSGWRNKEDSPRIWAVIIYGVCLWNIFGGVVTSMYSVHCVEINTCLLCNSANFCILPSPIIATLMCTCTISTQFKFGRYTLTCYIISHSVFHLVKTYAGVQSRMCIVDVKLWRCPSFSSWNRSRINCRTQNLSWKWINLSNF